MDLGNRSQEVTRKAKESFQHIVEHPDNEWPNLLGALEPEVRREVESLLRHDAAASSSFLAHSLLGEYGSRSFQPETIGPYTLGPELGRGGSSVVYLAHRSDNLFERRVAIKILRDPCAGPDAEERFRRELQILARLDHPNIVRLLDAGTTPQGLAFVVTEFVEGSVLDAKKHEMTYNQLAQFVLELAEGLSAAHRSGVVHRDIKPQNIIVTPEGRPRLVDFGIARLVEPESELTRTGESRMTVAYASPEQVDGRSLVGPASDVFSLGVVFYELLTGTRPFQGGTHLELVAAIQGYEPRNPTKLKPGSAQELGAICLKMLEKHLSDRYKSMDEVCQDMQAYLQGKPLSVNRKSWQQFVVHIRRRYLARTAAALGVLGIGGTGVFLYQRQVRRSEEAFLNVAAIARAANSDTRPVTSETGDAKLTRLVRDVNVLRMMVDREPKNNERARELRKSLMNLGLALSHPASQSIGDTSQSVEVYREAVALATRLHKADKDHVSDAIGFSMAKCSLGSVLIEQNRYSEAREQFADAIAANHETANKTHEERNRSAAYAEAIANLSRVSLHEGKHSECLRLRLQALEIRRRVSESVPSNHWFRYEVAGGLALYGWALREFGEFAAALRSYAEATEIVARLNQEQSGANRETLSLLAKNQYELGRINLALGDRKGAVQSFLSSVSSFRQIQAKEPHSMSNLRSMGLALSALSGLEPTRERATEMMDEALQYLERAARQDPSNAKVGEELALVRQRKEKVAALWTSAQPDPRSFIAELVRGR